eukprot:SAG11_NODE_11567_length_752_cov_1.026034_1_plen_65_part_10
MPKEDAPPAATGGMGVPFTTVGAVTLLALGALLSSNDGGGGGTVSTRGACITDNSSGWQTCDGNE